MILFSARKHLEKKLQNTENSTFAPIYGEILPMCFDHTLLLEYRLLMYTKFIKGVFEKYELPKTGWSEIATKLHW